MTIHSVLHCKRKSYICIKFW